MDAKTKYKPRYAIKIVLFWSNWLFVTRGLLLLYKAR
jgi:hypothetical protein